MKVPKKPSGRKRSPFYWWRRFRTHKTKPWNASLLAKIKNGDFEYPPYFQQADWELHCMKDEQKEFIENYKGFDNPENDTLCLLESLLKNTNEKIIFTLVPSNFILSLKLKIGRLLPRADRSPTLSPLNINNFIKEYQKKFDKEFGVSLASIGKVNDLFYTSEVLELKK